MSKAPPRARQRITGNKQEDICASVLFDVKMNFSPTLRTMHLQEIVQAELGARLLKNHLEKLRKAASLKDLAGTMGKELLNFKFSWFQRTVFLC